MKCPRDNSTLSPHKKGNIDIHVCQECHGFFLSLEQKSASQLEVLLQKQFTNPQSDSAIASVISPQSGHAMKRFEYRKVLLDYCADSHSIWFDRGEYSKIFAFNSTASKKIENKSDSSSWSVVDVVSAPFDVLDVSGDIIGAVGDLVGDLISGIDL